MPCPIKFYTEISIKHVSFNIVDWNLTDIRFQENMHNFLNFKLQKCDACQNGVEFCYKPISSMQQDWVYTLETDNKTLSPLVSNTRLRLKILESLDFSETEI